MFLYLLQGNLGQQMVASNRLILKARHSARTSHILSGALPYPISYADTSTGYVFMVNGFMPMRKWKSSLDRAIDVGVEAPTTAPTIASSGTGDITGTYSAYVRWLDADGNPSNLSPISNTISTIQDSPTPAEGEVAEVIGAETIEYSNVPITDNERVVRVQILRNTNGQTRVFYVDVDSTDLTGDTFSSALTDSELSAQEIVPLFDADGRSIANKYGVPPTHIAFIAPFQGRLFGAGVIEYAEGNAQTTFGSTSVVGIGTQWVHAMEGREFYVSDRDEVYAIESIDQSTQVITLDRAYEGETDLFAEYTIKPPPIQRRLVYFCEATSFDAWPAVNAFEIEENGDEVSGIASAESFLFILQFNHIYRLTYSVNPIIDGGIFLAADRGCVNDRCWVKVESTIYLMDEQGVYSFAAGGEPEPLSAPIQDLYWQLGGDSGKRVNWKNQRLFHAVLSSNETTIRWFICLDGARFPKASLCFNFITKDWWLEEMPEPIGASCLWRRKRDATVPLVAGPARKVLALNAAKLDLASPSGTVRGTATSATRLTLTDASAVFASQVGAPLVIADGTGKLQRRKIVEVDGTTLRLNRPFRFLPDTTSVYQIGGIPWKWRGIWDRWNEEDISNVRRLVLVFQPSSGKAFVRVYRDRLDTPQVWAFDWPPSPNAADAVTVRKNETDLTVDLANSIGFAQIRMDARKERAILGRDYFALEAFGCKGLDPIRLYEIIVEGSAK